jgi:hypothetical protein
MPAWICPGVAIAIANVAQDAMAQTLNDFALLFTS